MAELARAEANLLKRIAERELAECKDRGHEKAIEQAKERLKKALEKAKHCLSPEEIERILKILGGTLIVGGAVGVVITVPELLPVLPWLVPAFAR